MRERPPLSGRSPRGLLAGTAGTAAMTPHHQIAVAEAREAEPSTAPAEVARRPMRRVLHREASTALAVLRA